MSDKTEFDRIDETVFLEQQHKIRDLTAALAAAEATIQQQAGEIDEVRKRNGELSLQLREEKLRKSAPSSALLPKLEAAESATARLQERVERLEGSLREVLPFIERNAEDIGYGFYSGGDPRDFTPDPECATPEEIQRWKDDCARVAVGEQINPEKPEWIKEGETIIHLDKSSYGIGTYVYRDPEMCALLKVIAAALSGDKEGEK